MSSVISTPSIRTVALLTDTEGTFTKREAGANTRRGMAFSRRSKKKTDAVSVGETSSDLSKRAEDEVIRGDEGEAEPETQFSLDSLDIIKTIGTGTFARVCLAKQKGSHKYYALKILSMADVIKLKQVEHVKNEKNILSQVQHPFIVSMVWSHKDTSCLYMLFTFICGGELFSYLRSSGKFSYPTSFFYAAEIVSALEYLHSLSIIYRDMKPENLLLDREGHLKITDFGFAKKITDRTWTLCGTPEYLAPEIIQSKGHNKAVDWWALGILIYEMLAGFPPFFDDNPFGIYEKILSGKIDWPKSIDNLGKDLIKKLLVIDRTKRIGNLKAGADDVKKHKWFKGVDWEDVYYRKLKPPLVPKLKYEGDTSNFDDYPEDDLNKVPGVSEREQRIFDDF